MKLTFRWLKAYDFHFDGDTYCYVSVGTNMRPLKIVIDTSEENPEDLCISLWDEMENLVIYEGSEFTIRRFKQLYAALSGNSIFTLPEWD